MTSVVARNEDLKPRVLWLYGNMIGQVVQVAMRDEQIYEGIMMSKCPNSMDVVLGHARLKVAKSGDRTEKTMPKKSLKISAQDIIYINAIDMVLSAEKEAISVHGFQTDSDISKNGFGKERTLMKWTADTANTIAGFEPEAHTTGEWDQFSANEKLGVKSTYNENFYTTKLDKKQFSPEQHRKAEAIAAEIEGGGKHDALSWCDEMDEEQLHSAVARPEDFERLRAKATAGGGTGTAYVPPNRRQNKDDSSAPSTTQHTTSQQPAMPASMPLPQQGAPKEAPPSLVQRGEGPPLPIPLDCYQSNPATQNAAQQQPSSTPAPEPKKHGLEGRLGAELLKSNAQRGQNVLQLKEVVPEAAQRTQARVPNRNAEIQQFKLDSMRLGEAFGTTKKPTPAESTPSTDSKQAQQAAKAKPSKEIKQFMEDSERLTRAFQNKGTKVEKKDGAPAAPTAAAPTTTETEEELRASTAPVPASTNNRSKANIDWKPVLHSQFKDNKPEVCKIIGFRLGDRISSAKKPEKTEKVTNYPVPGDVENFSHEWKGDGPWCKNEAMENNDSAPKMLSTAGGGAVDARAPIVPATQPDAAGQHVQPMPPQVVPQTQPIQVQHQPQQQYLMQAQPNQQQYYQQQVSPFPQQIQQQIIQPQQQLHQPLAQPGTPQHAMNQQYMQPQVHYAGVQQHPFQQQQQQQIQQQAVLQQPQQPQQAGKAKDGKDPKDLKEQEQVQAQQAQVQQAQQAQVQQAQQAQVQQQQLLQQQAQQQHAQAQAQAQAQQHQHQHQHQQHHQVHQLQHPQHQHQHPQHQHQHQQLQHPQLQPQQVQLQQQQAAAQQQQVQQQQMQVQQRQQPQQLQGQMQQMQQQQMPPYYVQQQQQQQQQQQPQTQGYPYQYQMQPGQMQQQQQQQQAQQQQAQQQQFQMQAQYQNQPVTQLAPGGVPQTMMANAAVPTIQGVEMQMPLQRTGSFQQGAFPQEYRQQVAGMPPSPSIPQAHLARMPPSPAPPQANNMVRPGYNGRDVQSQLQQQAAEQPAQTVQHGGEEQQQPEAVQEGSMDWQARMPSPQGQIAVPGQRMQVQGQMPPSPASPYVQGQMPNPATQPPGQMAQMPPSPAPPTLPYNMGGVQQVQPQAPVHPHTLQQPGQMQQAPQMVHQQGMSPTAGMVNVQRNGQHPQYGNMGMNPAVATGAQQAANTQAAAAAAAQNPAGGSGGAAGNTGGGNRKNNNRKNRGKN
eukprot:TRINITY_DN304_c1_g1_i5.p1 TRINITY_DN304_c1_g1~~TRINITY_DN304_c1_g1_i5.p1  ORF type:complete len:1216 (+),score=325.34 TRINITY_DN304_c1_g1_i5:108-3755(+)